MILSGIRDSNPRPSAWEANALPTELIPQKLKRGLTCPLLFVRAFYPLMGADTRTRTGDLRITNALLYQLSHVGLPFLCKRVQRYEFFPPLANFCPTFLSRIGELVRFPVILHENGVLIASPLHPLSVAVHKVLLQDICSRLLPSAPLVSG